MKLTTEDDLAKDRLQILRKNYPDRQRDIDQWCATYGISQTSMKDLSNRLSGKKRAIKHEKNFWRWLWKFIFG